MAVPRCVDPAINPEGHYALRNLVIALTYDVHHSATVVVAPVHPEEGEEPYGFSSGKAAWEEGGAGELNPEEIRQYLKNYGARGAGFLDLPTSVQLTRATDGLENELAAATANFSGQPGQDCWIAALHAEESNPPCARVWYCGYRIERSDFTEPLVVESAIQVILDLLKRRRPAA